MAYPAPFHRLVILGTLYSDTFNTTLSFIPVGGGTIGAVPQTLCDNVATAVNAWWDMTLGGTPRGISFNPRSILTGVKLNRIGTDGRYMDATTIEKAITPNAGPASSAPAPAQLSVAATLRGSNPRNAAGKGRMFFPPTSACTDGLGADGRLSTTTATQYGEGVANLIQDLNDVYLAAGVSAVAGIASKGGSGAFQAVVDITVGRTVDTIRSRRNKIPEDFVEVSV